MTDNSNLTPIRNLRAHRGVSFTGITAIFVCYDDRGYLLLSKRSAHTRDEQGRWEFGGGGVRFGETVEEGVLREIREEYGAQPQTLRFIGHFDAFRTDAKGRNTHWLAMCFAARVRRESIHIGEPTKMDELGWFPLSALPEPRHSQIDVFLDRYADRLRLIISDPSADY